MDAKIIQTLIKNSIQYAHNASIAECDMTINQTSVVSLKNLENHLQQVIPVEYDTMKVYHDNVLNFFMSRMKIVEDDKSKWAYEILTTHRYNQRRSHNKFTALKSYQPYSSNLFIVYLKKAKGQCSAITFRQYYGLLPDT